MKTHFEWWPRRGARPVAARGIFVAPARQAPHAAERKRPLIRRVLASQEVRERRVLRSSSLSSRCSAVAAPREVSEGRAQPSRLPNAHYRLGNRPPRWEGLRSKGQPPGPGAMKRAEAQGFRRAPLLPSRRVLRRRPVKSWVAALRRRMVPAPRAAQNLRAAGRPEPPSGASPSTVSSSGGSSCAAASPLPPPARRPWTTAAVWCPSAYRTARLAPAACTRAGSGSSPPPPAAW